MGEGQHGDRSERWASPRAPPLSLLDDVRCACARVAAEAEHVTIAGDPVAYAHDLDLAATPVPSYDREHHFHSDDAEALAGYVLALDAINFGSGYFPHLRKRPGLSGYFTVASRLKDAWERGPLDAARLAALTTAEVADLMGQDSGHPLRAELIALFARALNDLGTHMLERHDGRALTLIGRCGGRAERLVEELIAMPLFRDTTRYRGFDVPLYKRAQIAASDLALAFEGEGPGSFDDLDRLTIFADNLVPHVLRVDGLLALSPALAARIDRGDEVPAGSPEEVELRAVALHAVERMVAGLRAEGRTVRAQQLDLILWNRGQAERYRRAPRQRTRTTFY